MTSLPRRGLSYFMKLKVGLGYALVLLFLAWYGFAFRMDISQIRFEPVWAARDAVFLAVVLSILNYALRMVRWSLYLSRLGHSISFGFTGLTYVAGFAFTLSPGKVGELVRGTYYHKIGIPLSTTTAAFFVERLMDLLAILMLAFLALADSSAYDVLIWGAVAAIFTMLAIVALTPWVHVADWVQNKDWLPASLKRTGKGILHMMLLAKALLQPRLLVVGLSIGIVAWGAEGIGFWLIAGIAPGASISWATATGIYSVAITVGALSFLPGGLGTTEAVMIALLTARNFPIPDAILTTLVCRLVTLWLAVGIGWGAVIALRHNEALQARAR